MKRTRELDAHMMRVGMTSMTGLTATVAYFKGRRSPRKLAPLVQLLSEGRRAVKGNRPAGSPVTPEDYQLLIASDLRTLLAELETAP